MQGEVTPTLRVLYCEDDADTREMVRLVLEADGFEVVCVENPADCLRAAREHRFNIYLLDNVMLDLPGTELCKRIREFDAHTPVVFFSGAAYPQDKDEARAAGAQAYITKPAQMSEVIRIIRNVSNVRSGYEFRYLEATDAEN